MQDSSLCMYHASSKGHLEVVKFLCEWDSKALLMLTDKVSSCACFFCLLCMLLLSWILLLVFYTTDIITFLAHTERMVQPSHGLLRRALDSC